MVSKNFLVQKRVLDRQSALKKRSIQTARTDRIAARAREVTPERLHSIFQTANRMLRRVPKDATVIFIGQGMRPLYESIRSINEVHQRVPADRLLYWVAPPKRNGQHTFSEKDRAVVLQKLAAQGITSATSKKFVIVDWHFNGSASGLLKESLRSLAPKGTVDYWNQMTSDYFWGIHHAETLPRPTRKIKGGELRIGTKKDRADYALFEQALQKYLSRKKKRS